MFWYGEDVVIVTPRYGWDSYAHLPFLRNHTADSAVRLEAYVLKSRRKDKSTIAEPVATPREHKSFPVHEIDNFYRFLYSFKTR